MDPAMASVVVTAASADMVEATEGKIYRIKTDSFRKLVSTSLILNFLINLVWEVMDPATVLVADTADTDAVRNMWISVIWNQF